MSRNLQVRTSNRTARPRRSQIDVDRIRRHIGRSTPDAIWRTFDYMKEDEYTRGYDEWLAWFSKMMKYKHGSNFRGINAFSSDSINEPFGLVRMQLVVQLYDPKRRPGSRTQPINVVYEMNKIEFEKQMLTPIQARHIIL